MEGRDQSHWADVGEPEGLFLLLPLLLTGPWENYLLLNGIIIDNMIFNPESQVLESIISPFVLFSSVLQHIT